MVNGGKARLRHRSGGSAVHVVPVVQITAFDGGDTMAREVSAASGVSVNALGSGGPVITSEEHRVPGPPLEDRLPNHSWLESRTDNPLRDGSGQIRQVDQGDEGGSDDRGRAGCCDEARSQRGGHPALPVIRHHCLRAHGEDYLRRTGTQNGQYPITPSALQQTHGDTEP